jgi:hypothetical protein
MTARCASSGSFGFEIFDQHQERCSTGPWNVILSANAADLALPLSIPDWWTTALRVWVTANSNLHQTGLHFRGEWQAFVGRRLNEDFGLLQRISTANAPGDVWNARSFWQKGAEDYAAECSVMARLTAGFLVTQIARLQAKAT